MLNSRKYFVLLIVMCGVMTCGFHAAAYSQVPVQPNVYVSAGTGVDNNTCSRTAPCREIVKALTIAASDGTVVILDSGDYKNFAITKSVSVIAQPGVSAIVRSGGVFLANSSPIRVVLRGITTEGSALYVGSPIVSLTVEDCNFFTSSVGPLYISSSGSFTFRNTRFRSLKGNPQVASIHADSGDALVLMENCSIENTFEALTIGAGAELVFRNSFVTNNYNGLVVEGGKLFVEGSLITGSDGTGISVSGSGWVRVSDSTITRNGGYGVENSGGYVRTFGNNRITNNIMGSFSGTVTTLALQ
jgi:Periplasmic copper-binding protein (NosD)